MLRLITRFKILHIFWATLVIHLVGFQLITEANPNKEYQIKAAFLFNFTKFIDWPPEAFQNSDMPIILGIFGSNPFGDALSPLRNKRVKGRAFRIVQIEDIEGVETCHILFICDSERNALNTVFQRIKGRNILTVGESESFTQKGGIINFFTSNNKIRFEVNITAAKRANLTISSKMLKLARVVNEDDN